MNLDLPTVFDLQGRRWTNPGYYPMVPIRKKSLILPRGAYYNGEDKENIMKRIFFTVAFLLIFLAVFPLSAQEESSSSSKSTAYTKIFMIAKIWTHRLGYRVDYFTSRLEIKQLYIPMAQFSGTDSKARLVYGIGPEYPYLSVTWIDGELDQVTIYGVDAIGDLSWGILRTNQDLTGKFSEDLVIGF